jgi:hypothetical protein
MPPQQLQNSNTPNSNNNNAGNVIYQQQQQPQGPYQYIPPAYLNPNQQVTNPSQQHQQYHPYFGNFAFFIKIKL